MRSACDGGNEFSQKTVKFSENLCKFNYIFEKFNFFKSFIVCELTTRFGKKGVEFSGKSIFGDRKCTMCEKKGNVFSKSDRSYYRKEKCLLLNYIINSIGRRKNEALVAIFLGRDSNINGVKLYSNGDEGAISIGVRGLINSAIECEANQLLLAHNHPSGIAKPSSSDIDETIRAQKVILTAGIKLIDHFVVSGEDIFSILHNKKVKGYCHD